MTEIKRPVTVRTFDTGGGQMVQRLVDADGHPRSLEAIAAFINAQPEGNSKEIPLNAQIARELGWCIWEPPSQPGRWFMERDGKPGEIEVCLVPDYISILRIDVKMLTGNEEKRTHAQPEAVGRDPTPEERTVLAGALLDSTKPIEAVGGSDDATALERADRIIGWMAEYLGQMATPSGGILDLNEHCVYMERRRAVLAKAPHVSTKPTSTEAAGGGTCAAGVKITSELCPVCGATIHDDCWRAENNYAKP